MKFERQTKLKPQIKIQIFFHESGNLLCGHLEEIDQQNQCDKSYFQGHDSCTPQANKSIKRYKFECGQLFSAKERKCI